MYECTGFWCKNVKTKSVCSVHETKCDIITIIHASQCARQHENHVFIFDFLFSLVLESRGMRMKTGPQPSCTEQRNVTNCTRKHSSRIRTARFSSSGGGRSAQSPQMQIPGGLPNPLDAEPGMRTPGVYPPPMQTSLGRSLG